MAYPYYCSISKQDCPLRFPYDSYNRNFTSSSCVPYHPWYVGDVGVCGWVGAPCAVVNGMSNCNLGAGYLCVKGRCGFGLGDQCPTTTELTTLCNGDLWCGYDNICGGQGAYVSGINVPDPCHGEDCVPVRELCLSGSVERNTTTGSFECTTPPPHKHTPKRTAAIAGGTLGALSILLFLLLAFLYQTRNRVRKAKAKAGTRLGGDGVGESDGEKGLDGDEESGSVSVSDVETLVDGGQEKGSG